VIAVAASAAVGVGPTNSEYCALWLGAGLSVSVTLVGVVPAISDTGLAVIDVGYVNPAALSTNTDRMTVVDETSELASGVITSVTS
jgi:hypothetical protein